MSIRTLLIWIIIAGALGGGVLVTRVQQDAARQDTPVARSQTIGFDPAGTVGLERVVGGVRQILARDAEQSSRWILHWSQGGMDSRWLVGASKARSGIRVLATARAIVSDEDLVTVPAGEVVIRQSSGDVIRVEFDSQSSGGYTAIRVEERASDGVATKRWFGRIERSVSDVFISDGLLGWRSNRVFDIPSSAVRAVELEAAGTSVSLARTNTGWTVAEPMQTHGDTQRIEDLIKVLISLEASAFVDADLDSVTTGIDTPIATLRITTMDESSSLVIGTRSDVGGSSVYAKLETPTGSAMITLEIDQLSELTASSEAYVGKTPSPASATAIGGLRINGRDGKARLEASRSMGNWTIEGNAADSLNRDAIDRLIGVLTRDPAQVVRVLEADTAVAALGSVELLGQDGAQIDRFDVALDSTEAGMRLLVLKELESGQRVLWATVSDEAAATGAWLTAVAGKRVP